MILNRSVAPPAQAVQHVDFTQATTYYLSNGVPVHVIRAGKQPVLGIELVFRQAGTKHQAQDSAGFFTFKMLGEGTQQRSGSDIYRTVDSLGAFLQLSPGTDYSSVEIYALSKHADPLLQLLAELITEATFPAEELSKLKDIQQQKLRVSNEKSSVLASKKMKAVLFGEHPYGKSMTEESIAHITQPTLQHFYQRIQSQWEVILSGDVSEAVLQSVEKHLGEIKNVSAYQHQSSASVSRLFGPKKYLIEKEENSQSSIRIGMPLFTKKHPDYWPMQVVNTLLGGYFGSRLMRNIREEKGLTYGISSGMLTLAEAGCLIIGTDVKKADTQTALAEIYQEIEKLRSEPVDNTELHTVKNYLSGKLLRSVNTPFALTEKFKSVYLYGLDYNFYQNCWNTLASLSSEDVFRTAQQHLNLPLAQEVVVGGYA